MNSKKRGENKNSEKEVEVSGEGGEGDKGSVEKYGEIGIKEYTHTEKFAGATHNSNAKSHKSVDLITLSTHSDVISISCCIVSCVFFTLQPPTHPPPFRHPRFVFL